MNRLTAAGLLVLASLAATAEAQDTPPLDFGPRVGFLGQLDLDYGGDDVATVFFEDDESQNVKAGQGMAVSVGPTFARSPAQPSFARLNRCGKMQKPDAPRYAADRQGY